MLSSQWALLLGRRASHSLFSTVCRVVNQLTLRPQRGDYGAYGLRPPYMTRLSQRPWLIHILPACLSACQLDHFNMPKKSNTHTPHPEPLSKYWKVKSFSSSWFMPQILIIYCQKKVYILHMYIHSLFHPWGVVSEFFKCLFCCWFWLCSWWISLFIFPS